MANFYSVGVRQQSPHWSKTGATEKPLFNARSETVLQKPTFKSAFSRGRCLLPASGWYEWSRTEEGTKHPYYLKLKERSVLTFAGLFDVWRGENEKPLVSCKEATIKRPELRPPHDALNNRENAILELAFWQGLTYKEVGKRFTFSAGRASQVANNALLKLTYHVQRGGRLGTATQGPPDPHHDPRLGDFAKAHAAQERLRVARRHPELKPPHAFLTNRENVVLEWTYWQGRSDEDHATPFHLTQKELRAVRNRAFRKLNDHYQHLQPRQAFQHAPPRQPEADGEPAGKERPSPIPSGEDAPITALLQAGPAEKRRKVAERYPQLRPPQPCLSDEENELLELAFWQARTYREIAELKSLARKDVGTRLREALKKLDQHLHGESHQDEDCLGEVLLALNECGSVRQAAKKLELPKDVLKAFIEREGVKTRFVFEVEP